MERGVFSIEWLARSSQNAPESHTGSGSPRRAEGPDAILSSQTKQRDGGIWQRGSSALQSVPSECKERFDGASAGTLRPDARGCGKGARAAEERGSSGISAGQESLTEEEEEEEACARPRTKFSVKQLRELERSFQEHRYIGANEKRRLAKVLKLSEVQIKTWFQNRRMKFKRQTQDARVDAYFSGLLHPHYSCPELQSPGCPVQSAFSTPPSSMIAPTLGFSLFTPQPFLSVPAPALQPALVRLPGLCPLTPPTFLPLAQEFSSPRFYPYPTSS